MAETDTYDAKYVLEKLAVDPDLAEKDMVQVEEEISLPSYLGRAGSMIVSTIFITQLRPVSYSLRGI